MGENQVDSKPKKTTTHNDDDGLFEKKYGSTCIFHSLGSSGSLSTPLATPFSISHHSTPSRFTWPIALTLGMEQNNITDPAWEASYQYILTVSDGYLVAFMQSPINCLVAPEIWPPLLNQHP